MNDDISINRIHYNWQVNLTGEQGLPGDNHQQGLQVLWVQNKVLPLHKLCKVPRKQTPPILQKIKSSHLYQK